MLKKKRLVFLLTLLLICNTIFASMVPIRSLAEEQGAEVTYTKENGVGHVEYSVDGNKLDLNLKTGVVTDKNGENVNVPIKFGNDGITYVDSKEFKEAIKAQGSNKDFLSEILKKIYSALTTTLTSRSNNNVRSLTDTSSSDTTTHQTYYVTNMCISTTRSSITKTHSAIGVMYEIKISEPSEQDFITKLYVDGVLLRTNRMHTKFHNPMYVHTGAYAGDVNLTTDSIVRVETTFYGSYSFNGNYVNSISADDPVFISIYENEINYCLLKKYVVSGVNILYARPRNF